MNLKTKEDNSNKDNSNKDNNIYNGSVINNINYEGEMNNGFTIINTEDFIDTIDGTYKNIGKPDSSNKYVESDLTVDQ